MKECLLEREKNTAKYCTSYHAIHTQAVRIVKKFIKKLGVKYFCVNKYSSDMVLGTCVNFEKGKVFFR